MAIDPAAGGLLKALIDIVVKRLPDPNDKVRIRILEEVLRQTVDRNTELEGIGELLTRVEAQRDRLINEVGRLSLRNRMLEEELEVRNNT